MSEFFPADVSLRIEGDNLAGAQPLIPSANNLLFKALEQQRLQGATNISMFREAEDGSLISVRLSGALKHVYIAPSSPKPPEAPEEPKYVPPEDELPVIYDMLSGVVRAVSGHLAELVTLTIPDQPDQTAVDDFHPDAVCAAAYSLVFDWQQPIKLGVDDEGHVDADAVSPTANSAYPKPGMYSGAMTRVVEAVLGLGRVYAEDTSEFVTGDPMAGTPDTVAWNHFEFGWLKTHGIFKGDDGSIWLIEVSKDNGVLAMPLPIYNHSDSGDLLGWVDTIGDTDTLNVLLEFGGLPTGETFPADPTSAIADGTVLQLLLPDAIAEFYYDSTNLHDKGPFYPACGWAFSDTGARIQNITTWYSRPEIALADFHNWLTDGYGGAAAQDRYRRSDRWEITISLLDGALTAAAALIEQGVNINLNKWTDPYLGGGFLEDVQNETLFRAPVGNTENLTQISSFGRLDAPAIGSDEAIPAAPVHVFFVGETPEVVYRKGHIGDPYLQGYFFGNFVDLGTSHLQAPIGGTLFGDLSMIGLVIPVYCREGYVLVRFHIDSGYDSSTPTIHPPAQLYQTGYFKGIGLVDFTTTTLPNTVTTWNYDWWIYRTNYTPTPGTTFGASINAGPTVAYVLSDGINPFALSGQGTNYVYAPTLTSFGIPADTKAQSITFVGSV